MTPTYEQLEAELQHTLAELQHTRTELQRTHIALEGAKCKLAKAQELLKVALGKLLNSKNKST